MLPFNLPELEVSGLALVTAIDDCPPIADGGGSVVTARFVTREVHIVASVDVLGADGTVETITGTTIHPVWSVDRQEWVPLAELVDGERLQGLDGLAVVLGVTLSRVTQPVYNIEVHGEHVYQVGELGVLVHNACANVSELIGRQLKSEFSGSLIKRIKRDMKSNGFNPERAIEIVIVNGKKIIWDGHHRARAAGAAGIKEVPVKILEKSPEVMSKLWHQAAEAASQLGLPF